MGSDNNVTSSDNYVTSADNYMMGADAYVMGADDDVICDGDNEVIFLEILVLSFLSLQTHGCLPFLELPRLFRHLCPPLCLKIQGELPSYKTECFLRKLLHAPIHCSRFLFFSNNNCVCKCFIHLFKLNLCWW